MKITTIRLLALALAISVCAGGALLLLPNPSHAQVTCPPATGDADADADGLTNAEECSGIGNFPICSSGLDRNTCMDPNSKDVFIIVAPVSGGWFNTIGDLLATLKGTGAGKLNIAIHEISDAAAPNRQVTSGQHAIRIAESLNTSEPGVLGSCIQGTPNDEDGCVVYTQRIVNFLNTKCPGTTCKISPSTTLLTAVQVLPTYIRNSIAHEVSHSMGLGAQYDAEIGNHYVSGTNVVMDTSVYYVSKGKNPTIRTFNLPGAYAAADPQAVTLK